MFRIICVGLTIVGLLLSLSTSCGPTTSSTEGDTTSDAATPKETALEASSETNVTPDKQVTPKETQVEQVPEATQPPCFYDQPPGKSKQPNYKQYSPKVGSHCDGTDHQDIKDVELVVFVGDSITKGTPPTPEERFFRTTLTTQLKKKFGDKLEVKDCSKWGGRNDDLLLEPHKQLLTCLPNPVENKRTLVIFTSGGNDMQSYAKDAQRGKTLQEIMVNVKRDTQLLRDAIKWVKDPKRFPNGSYVVFGNVYEFTDGTGDVKSCKAASAVGLDKDWPEARNVYVALNEEYMKIAVETKTDIFFLLERFCGHGFHHDDKTTECYQPGAKPWFDFSCIHPNPDGHDQITKMIMNVVNE